MDENTEKEFHTTVGVFDVLSRSIRKKVKEEAKKEGHFGIGVLTDDYCEITLSTRPLKSTDERMEIAQNLDGVDFVFPVDRLSSMERAAQEAFEEFKQREDDIEKIKKYDVGFIIGSFDMFHNGHLENINIAKACCKRLFVVLKTDERISKNKNKKPQQSTAERAAILKSLKQIEDVLYMDLETTRGDVLNDVMEASGISEKRKIAAIFGSDLREKEEKHADEWDGIDIIFTKRDPEKMKTVSSTNYEVMCVANGGLKRLEDIEKTALEESSNDQR